MAARTFEDSAGTVWEVFEVHRASEAPRGVSPGLERGWLSFVSPSEKRRLAPFPAGWQAASDRELAQLCAAARIANPARYPGVERRAVPRDELSFPVPGPLAVRGADDGTGAAVREVIRSFATDARAQRLPAIEALVRLKALLVTRFSGSEVPPATAIAASDMRRVRRWFVESYYFERR